jgi:maltose alpha-D-glucosyltransferase / alpha-amylase
LGLDAPDTLPPDEIAAGDQGVDVQLSDVRSTQVRDPLWYKDAVFYQLHVKAFADSNHDGIGDFIGLTEHLDYLQELGVTALWLLPFYPSPGRDDGYDIADYRRVNPDFGTMRDFRRFMAEAKRRNIRVIIELVINHTSDQHPWFKRARRSAPHTDARNWYVWSNTDQRYLGTRIIFTDTEKSNWAWDPVAGGYYWHRFFSHQPDLNYDNPRVLWAMVQVMRRWLDMGVDGFRLDAIPYLCEREGTSSENLPETHAVLKKIRAELDSYAPDRVLLAEANQWPEDVSAYFGQGDGDECHMAYNFPLMPRMYMAIAQEDRHPIADILRQTPDTPPNCQWALFLRNHDELTLEMVTDVERDYLWSTYAADPRARLNFGIRRRLAPLMDNDRRKIELMNSLLLSFPGTPIIYYGDEIGMGDNIYLGDRNGVRTPMQWTPDRNGGFSRCDPAKLFLPMIMDPVYGYQAVNVEAQSHSLSSLLNWMKRLIAVRKSTQVFGRGTLQFLRPSNRAVLAFVRQYGHEVVLCVANLSRSAQAAEIDLSPWRGYVPHEMIGRTKFPRISEQPYLITLVPYGFFWFRLSEDAGTAEPPRVPEFVTVVFSHGWRSFLEPRTRQILERDVLPPFLSTQRWFAAKGERYEVGLKAMLPLAEGDPGFSLALIEVSTRSAATLYALPLGVKWSRFDTVSAQLQRHIVGPARRGPQEGVLLDAAADRDFVAWLLTVLHAGTSLERGGRSIEFRPTRPFVESKAPMIEAVHWVGTEQSNTTLIADSAIVIKLYRRLEQGANPEIEIGHFLTEAGYQNAPALLGSIELEDHGARTALGVVHRFVENQGDAWSLTAAYLDRFVDEQKLLAQEIPTESAEHAAYLPRMQQIGRRTAEMQLALASGRADADFAPEPVRPEDLRSWTDRLRRDTARQFESLARRIEELPQTTRAAAQSWLAHSEAVLARIGTLLPEQVDCVKARHHGDFHLGQILIVKDDVFVLDFEGEPRRTIEERRRKMPAARDLAGLTRSIDYATAAALARVVPASAEEQGRLERALVHWRDRSTEALLAAYRGVTGIANLWPERDSEASRLLDFFILEKLVYEIGYELSHRPDWLAVPLAAASRMLFPAEAQP